MNNIDNRRKVRRMAILVASTFFMENLDATIITTALPSMALSFSIEPQELSIGISAYMLALAVGLPASSWLAARFTARHIFCLSVILFVVASLLCAFASSLTFFTGARLLQGLSGSLMVPVGRTVVLSRTEKNDLVNIISIMVWPGLIAPVLGPVLGGMIAQYLSWQWIFLLNLPLGIIALFFAIKILPHDIPHKTVFDWPGFIGLGLGLLLLVYGLEILSQQNGNLWLSLSSLLASIAILSYTAYHLSSTNNPLINLFAFSHRSFRTSFIGGSFFRIALSSVPFLLPLMFQLSFGWTPVEAGSLLLALFLGNIVMKMFTTRMLRWFGFRNILIANGLLVALSFILCAFFDEQSPTIWIVAVLFLSGAARSMQFTAINTMSFAEIEQQDVASANILFTVVQQINNVLGIVLAALFLYLAQLIHNHNQSSLSIADFQLALFFISSLTIIALIDFITLPKGIGNNVTGYKKKSD